MVYVFMKGVKREKEETPRQPKKERVAVGRKAVRLLER